MSSSKAIAPRAARAGSLVLPDVPMSTLRSLFYRSKDNHALHSDVAASSAGRVSPAKASKGHKPGVRSKGQPSGSPSPPDSVSDSWDSSSDSFVPALAYEP